MSNRVKQERVEEEECLQQQRINLEENGHDAEQMQRTENLCKGRTMAGGQGMRSGVEAGVVNKGPESESVTRRDDAKRESNRRRTNEW